MKPKISEIILIILPVLLTAGCADIDIKSIKQAAYVAPLFTTKECTDSKNSNDINIINDPCYRQSESIDDSLGLCVVTNVSKAQVTTATSLDGKGCSAYLMRVSDNICNKHLAGIFTSEATSNVIIGMLAAGAGIAGGLVPGLNAANALSGAAGFLTGSRALINEEVYRNSVGVAIIKEIQKNRETIAKTITETANNTVNDLEKIKNEVNKYHEACSFYAGLSSLIGNAGQSTNAVARIQERISSLKADEDKIGASSTDTKEEIKKQRESLERALLYLGTK